MPKLISLIDDNYFWKETLFGTIVLLCFRCNTCCVLRPATRSFSIPEKRRKSTLWFVHSLICFQERKAFQPFYFDKEYNIPDDYDYPTIAFYKSKQKRFKCKVRSLFSFLFISFITQKIILMSILKKCKDSRNITANSSSPKRVIIPCKCTMSRLLMWVCISFQL